MRDIAKDQSDGGGLLLVMQQVAFEAFRKLSLESRNLIGPPNE